ncbi:MAG TPA: hypothetical protein VL134_09415 [Leptolyngbya sp.]|nr:hypothetical protein [Leptolyngbya sp.]
MRQSDLDVRLSTLRVVCGNPGSRFGRALQVSRYILRDRCQKINVKKYDLCLLDQTY